jgi:SAM-dependent methyltransferase
VFPSLTGVSNLPDDWRSWRDQEDLGRYDERFRRLADAGLNPHGEADLVASYAPDTVLDGGCGTGRVAIELARRGIAVLGVDADPDMIAAARAKAPELEWVTADLADLDHPRRFDMVVLAGNVVPYVAPERRARAVAACVAHLAPGGRLVAGFQLRPSWPTPDDYDRWCAAAGAVPDDRFATWERAPYAGGDYVVSVHRRDQGTAAT